MALDQHWKDMYSQSMTQLAGSQFKNRLGQYVKLESEKGINVWFDSYAPLDAATDNLVTDSSGKYRMEYEEAGVATFAAWIALQTPHTQIAKSRTQCPLRIIEAGYTFRELDDVAENANPQSDVLKTIMRVIVAAEDANLLNVMTSTTAFRGRDLSSGATVNMPASQVLDVPGGIAAFDKDIVATISQKFEESYIDGERATMVITPAMKASLIINSGDVLQNADFIDYHHKHMQNYTLPDVYGVHMVTHPLMSSYSVSVLGTHAEGIAVAFVADWGKWNKAQALTTKIDEAPTQRYSYILYINEFCNGVRIDDQRLIIVGFGTIT